MVPISMFFLVSTPFRRRPLSLLLLQTLLQQSANRLLEFFKVYYSITIDIGLHQQLLPYFFVHRRTALTRGQVIEVIQRYAAITVIVQYLKYLLLNFFVLQHLAVDASGHEFLEIDLTILIMVYSFNKLIPVNIELSPRTRVHHLLQFLQRKCAISIDVQANEFTLQHIELSL